ncbi:MAG: GNAT family N-acetyltransferase [Magnetospirillum sp.]|nr:GNAT family N-acetyltransferase [Magnetospirillum sp.]
MEIARLIHASLPEYYDLLPVTAEMRLAAIADMVGTRGTELERVRVAMVEGRPMGVLAGIPAAGLRRAHILATLALLRQVAADHRARCQTDITDFATQIELVGTASYYLARIAVAPAARGMGIADCLMAEFLTEAGTRPASLHVKTDNERAIRFYRRHGFADAETGVSPRRYRAMIRPVD